MRRLHLTVLLYLLFSSTQVRAMSYAGDYPIEAIPLYASTPTSVAILFLTGNFTHIGHPTGSVAQVDATSAALVPIAAPTVKGEVNSMIGDGAGGVLLGGQFEIVGNSVGKNLAHLKADGSLDLAFNPQPNNAVHALVLSGNTLYVGGEFTQIAGQSRSYAAALNAMDGGLIPAWNPAPNAAVRALEINTAGTWIYGGGNFSLVNGSTTRNGLAAFSTTDGTASSWAVRSGTYYDLDLSPDGNRLYAIGDLQADFSGFNTSTGAREIAATLNGDGAAVKVSADGTKVYIGGSFSTVTTSAGASTRSLFAAIDVTSGSGTVAALDAGFIPEPFNQSSVRDIQLDVAGNIHVGGTFRTVGGLQRHSYAVLNPTTGVPTAFDPKAGGLGDQGFLSGVRTILIPTASEPIRFGGDFSIVGGQYRNRIAAIDLMTNTLLLFNPNVNGTVADAAVSPDGQTLYVTGNFTTVNNSFTRNRAAAFTIATGDVTTWNPNLNAPGFTLAFAPDGQRVFIGGNFSTVNGSVSRNSLAAFNTTDGTVDAAFNPNVAGNSGAGFVLDMQFSNSILYTGGLFNTVGGSTPRNSAAAFNPATGVATAWNPNLTDINGGSVVSGAVEDLEISADGAWAYLGGRFRTVNGNLARNSLAAFNTTDGTVHSTFNPNVTTSAFAGDVRALSLSDNVLYFGGSFTAVGGATRNSAAALNLTDNSLLSWNPNINNGAGVGTPSFVYTLTASVSKVYIGGDFDYAGTTVSPNFFIADAAVLSAAALDEQPPAFPKQFFLLQNYPNPFNPQTAISYTLNATSEVSLKVFDVLGREVATLVSERQSAGQKNVRFDAAGLSSGVYFYRLQTKDFIETKKMLLVK